MGSNPTLFICIVDIFSLWMLQLAIVLDRMLGEQTVQAFRDICNVNEEAVSGVGLELFGFCRAHWQAFIL